MPGSMQPVRQDAAHHSERSGSLLVAYLLVLIATCIRTAGHKGSEREPRGQPPAKVSR